MPRTLKRRSDAISRDADDESAASTAPVSQRARHQRSPSASSGSTSGDSPSNDVDTQSTSTQTSTIQSLTKKLIRLALASEYSRIPLRRAEISQKIFKDSNASARLFRPVFAAAQTQLQAVFGMQLVELPSKDKTSLKDRRAQATQQQNAKSQTSNAGGASSKSWILVSTLPHAYKTNPVLAQPNLASSRDTEATYTALYTFILSLIYLNDSTLLESKLERYLKRVNSDTYTPFGSLDKLLSRMIKDGYIEKRRDLVSGEEVVEYLPGPRGKIEVGVKGVAGLVRSVYGFGAVGIEGDTEDDHASARQHQEENDEDEENNNNDNRLNSRTGNGSGAPRLVKIDKDDLKQRLKRSLGIDVIDLGVSGSVSAAAQQRSETGNQQQPDEDESGSGSGSASE